jgi:alanyl-tRNA synthetase
MCSMSAPLAAASLGQGSGLGLSVSYGIIDSCGGKIGYVGRERRGATFFFELPAIDLDPETTMTERLYYSDPYNREFDAAIARSEMRSGRRHLWLDRSSFYPTSGGQPFDTGMLGPHRVVDVLEDENGEVVHVLGADVEDSGLQPGARLHGVIDWTRRFDHMQQHSGQHVLSAAFDRLFGVRTVSFHLGAETSTIDLAREMSAAEMAAAEDEANRVVWDDRPVAIRYASADEAARMPLRKEPAREGTLRLIEIEHFDLSACGGTHVSRTGAIGVIAIAAAERFKGGHRVEFVCGGRALGRFRMLREAAASSQRLLSVLPGELPSAIERLQIEAREQKKAVAALQTELAGFRAEALAREAEVHAAGRLLLKALDADAAAIKAIASAVAARPGFIVVLVSTTSPAVVVAARAADVAISAHEIVSALTKRFGGRGGGKPDLAQGGGLTAPPTEILAAVRELIARRPT